MAEILAVIALLGVAVGAGIASIGAAIAYAEHNRSFDGKGAYFCAALAIVCAFIAGMLL